MSKRIIIAGGGTGGHIFPAVAVANALKQIDPAVKILFVGAKGKMEMQKVPAAGYDIRGLQIAGLNRSHWWKNLSLPFKLVSSFFSVRKIFSEFKPQAVFGVGGYSSFPVLRYAQARGIPTFLHEANAFAGRANMMLGKKAAKVFVAHYGMEKFFDESKLLITGNPVRKNLLEKKDAKKEALNHFTLSGGVTTVLVIGGSLGARTINLAIKNGLHGIAEKLQLLWQTGTAFYEEAKAAAAGYEAVIVLPFIDRMDLAYQAADVVVSRSGAMSVTELTLLQKPTIFVPYPFATEDHQTANAKALSDRKAAILVADKDASAKLVPELLALTSNENRITILRENLQAIEVNDNADELIANYILQNS